MGLVEVTYGTAAEQPLAYLTSSSSSKVQMTRSAHFIFMISSYTIGYLAWYSHTGLPEYLERCQGGTEEDPFHSE